MSARVGTLNLLTVMAYAPLTGIVPGKPEVLHALELEPLVHALTAPGDIHTVTAACGVEAKVIGGKGGTIYAWPIPTRLTRGKRCPECRRICGGRINPKLWPELATTRG